MSLAGFLWGGGFWSFWSATSVFFRGERAVLPALVQRAFGSSPVTFLAAIIVPMVLAPNGQGLELTWRNPQLVASIVAILVCAATKRQLLTIVIALIAFFGWKFGVLVQ